MSNKLTKPQTMIQKRQPGFNNIKSNDKHIQSKDSFDPQNPENETNFKKAYAKLATKISSQESDDPKLLVNEDELKEIEVNQETTNFHQRVQHLQEKTKTKVKQIKAQLEEKEMAECTFAPKLTKKTEKRKLEDFLKDQQKHLDKHKETVEKITQENMEKEEQEMVAHPRINEHSKVLTAGKSSREEKPVHERLYSKNKKEITNVKPEMRKPSKDIIARQLTLYEEAKKRQERANERQKKEEEDLKACKFSKGFAKDPYIKQKFSKEFNSVLESLEIKNTSAPLTYDQMCNCYYLS